MERGGEIMMRISELEIGNINGVVGVVSMKGTFSKPKRFFSVVTDKIIDWADLELDYCGG
jgi:hypothetical protein